MPGDYDGDGDGDDEAALLRDGVWWMSSQPGPVLFGVAGDIGLLRAAVRMTYFP